jgi:hypothetical protein
VQTRVVLRRRLIVLQPNLGSCATSRWAEHRPSAETVSTELAAERLAPERCNSTNVPNAQRATPMLSMGSVWQPGTAPGIGPRPPP